VEQGFGVVWRQVKRAVERLDGRCRLAAVDLQAAQVDERADILAVALEAFAIGGFCLAGLALHVQRGGQRQVQLGALGLERHGLAGQRLGIGGRAGLLHLLHQLLDFAGGGLVGRGGGGDLVGRHGLMCLGC
jgi:hypothetical protein